MAEQGSYQDAGSNPVLPHYHIGVAQLVERVSEIHEAAGSNPAPDTTFARTAPEVGP